MASTVESGSAAEDAAAAHLVSLGYVIVERNYRCKLGEIDIVARHRGELVFVEVRSRADDRRGAAVETVGPTKQRQVARIADHYISERKPQFDGCRFDVVAITGGDIEVFVDAFRPGDPT